MILMAMAGASPSSMASTWKWPGPVRAASQAPLNVVHLNSAITWPAAAASLLSGRRVLEGISLRLVSSVVQLNVLASYPSCTRVPFVSTSGWRLVSFERLSIRLPDRFRVPSGPIAFDHGGQLWKSHDIEVSIAKLMGMSILINARWLHGETVLHFLAVEGFTEGVKFLAERGADVNAVNEVELTCALGRWHRRRDVTDGPTSQGACRSCEGAASQRASSPHSIAGSRARTPRQ
jgi:hypothetical protein